MSKDLTYLYLSSSLRKEVVPVLNLLTGSSKVALSWAMGHKLILSFVFWKQLHAYEFHRCMLFIKKNGKGSRVRPWNNLFHRTEWIISHNEQLLARTAANTEQSHSSIIQGPYAYQGHSLMYWGLIGVFCPVTQCPSKGSGFAHHSDPTNSGVHFH